MGGSLSQVKAFKLTLSRDDLIDCGRFSTPSFLLVVNVLGCIPFLWIVDFGWFEVDHQVLKQVSWATVKLETRCEWLLLSWPGWPSASALYSSPQRYNGTRWQTSDLDSVP